MISKPNVKSLNYIRQKDHLHGEALDDIITAIQNGPSFVDHEVPTGNINGSNTVFLLATTPNPASSLHLYKDGVLLQTSAYVIVANKITLSSAPSANSTLTASYRN
jgi:hypothetical protein